MSTEYEINILKQDTGYLQRIVPAEEFVSIKTSQEVGAFTFIVAAELLDWALLKKDARIIIWRKPAGGAKKLYHAGFIRYKETFYEGNVEKYIVSGPDYVEILTRRIIAYNAGSAHCVKDAAVDDMMKAFVRENLGALCVDTARDISDYGFAVEKDRGQGTVLKKEASRRSLLDVLQEISLASKKVESTATFFDVVPSGQTGYNMKFVTKIKQPGMDHRFPSGEDGPVWFAVERGNMANPRRTHDSHDEVNYVYAAGTGEEEDRIVSVVSDNARIKHSVINRREALFDGRNVDTAEELTDEGNELLAEGRPVSTFSFTVVQTEKAIYGIHWDIGCRVTASYKKWQYDMFVISVAIRWKDNVETITVTLSEEL